MFTGLVEEVGKIKQLQSYGSSLRLEIQCRKIRPGLAIGDSVCSNGVCLTVTDLGEDSFFCDVMHESVRCSSLAQLRPGSSINLEQALPVNGRLGGHIVSGHIDGTAVLQGRHRDEIAQVLELKASPDLLRYIVEKGSVALDGISLTVAAVWEEGFSVSVIPHTLQATSLSEKKVGDRINVETDLVGKYVEKLLAPYRARSQENKPSGLRLEDLLEEGF